MEKSLKDIAAMLYDKEEEQTAFVTTVESKGLKLADLSLGEYVSKAKFDDRMTKFTNLKVQYDELKNSANVSEDVKKEIETYKSQVVELTTARDALQNKVKQSEYLSSVDEAKIDKPFRNFVMDEVQKNVSDTMSFKDCLSKYIADNPQYVVKDDSQKSSSFNFSNSSLGSVKKEATDNESLNNFIRGI